MEQKVFKKIISKNHHFLVNFLLLILGLKLHLLFYLQFSVLFLTRWYKLIEDLINQISWPKTQALDSLSGRCGQKVIINQAARRNAKKGMKETEKNNQDKKYTFTFLQA